MCVEAVLEPCEVIWLVTGIHYRRLLSPVTPVQAVHAVSCGSVHCSIVAAARVEKGQLRGPAVAGGDGLSADAGEDATDETVC